MKCLRHAFLEVIQFPFGEGGPGFLSQFGSTSFQRYSQLSTIVRIECPSPDDLLFYKEYDVTGNFQKKIPPKNPPFLENPYDVMSFPSVLGKIFYPPSDLDFGRLGLGMI